VKNLTQNKINIKDGKIISYTGEPSKLSPVLCINPLTKRINMINDNKKASIADVQIGLYTIQGLLSEDGEFGIGVPQIAEEFQLAKDHATRTLKSLLGKTFEFSKYKTPLNPKAINALSLSDFEKLLAKLDRAGNQKAQDIRDGLVGLSLHQLFCDAFEIKFEKENRQQWLVCRQRTKLTFRPFTDQLKAYGFKNPPEYAKFISIFQHKLEIKNGTRDTLPLEKLFILEEAQVKLATYIECGLTPWEALNRL
jgi:hypothetical protein